MASKIMKWTINMVNNGEMMAAYINTGVKGAAISYSFRGISQIKAYRKFTHATMLEIFVNICGKCCHNVSLERRNRPAAPRFQTAENGFPDDGSIFVLDAHGFPRTS
jgi:hypothetical protein